MQRLLPETEIEKKMMSMAAVFIEENEVLEQLFDLIGEETIDTLQSEKAAAPDTEKKSESYNEVLNHIGDIFFRLDMGCGPEAQEYCVQILEELWTVRNRESALSMLEDIRTQGHRTKFNVLKDCVADSDRITSAAMEKFKQIFTFDFPEDADMKLNDSEFRQLATWIQKTDRFVGDCGIMAWDAARLVHLSRLSYLAGYLDDNEAWSQILKMSPLAIGKFKDWREFALSFIIGRTFWIGEEDPQIKKCCERLLGHPLSPWQFFDTK